MEKRLGRYGSRPQFDRSGASVPLRRTDGNVRFRFHESVRQVPVLNFWEIRSARPRGALCRRQSALMRKNANNTIRKSITPWRKREI